MESGAMWGAGEQSLYDYRLHDRIWQRVAPELNPYPEVRAMPAMAEVKAEPTKPSEAEANYTALPGAVANPCCMGTAAAQELKVIEGFTYLEMEGRRQDLFLARRAPTRPLARQLREYAEEEGRRVREFLAVRYLITGECWHPVMQGADTLPSDFCAALRQRYHVTVCDAYNYKRAAEETLDSCLAAVFRRMSDEDYRQGERLLLHLAQLL